MSRMAVRAGAFIATKRLSIKNTGCVFFIIV